MKKVAIYLVVLGVFTLISCGKNRDVTYDEGPGIRELHDDIQYHFDEVTVNGVTYLVLEKDRNNPHEGFGFMALKGNKLVQNQDSTLAYLKTMLALQKRIMMKLENRNEAEVDQIIEQYLQENMP